LNYRAWSIRAGSLNPGGVEDSYVECRRLSAIISAETIDVAFVMSIQQIMKTQAITCTVPDRRKTEAVKQCPEGGISPWHPASILRRHPNTSLYLDTESASLLQKGKEI